MVKLAKHICCVGRVLCIMNDVATGMLKISYIVGVSIDGYRVAGVGGGLSICIHSIQSYYINNRDYVYILLVEYIKLVL